MSILSTVVPVFLMLVLGAFCNRKKIIAPAGMEGIKTAVTDIMLPVVLFNALGTISYGPSTAILFAVMAAQLIITLLIGYLLRPLLGKYGTVLPFLISGFEGGMMGYPLYSLLCGADQLSNIASIDIANTVYAFTLFTALLMSAGSTRPSPKDIVRNAFKSPVIYGILLGLLFGLTGWLNNIIASPYGQLYASCENILTCSVSAMILLSVGYDFNVEKSVMSACFKAAGLRLAVQVILLAVLWFVLKPMLATAQMKTALILYAFIPPMFITPIYTKDPENRKFISTTISLYSLITVAAFAIISIFF